MRSLATAGRRGQRASTSLRDLEYETRTELAVKDLTDGTYKPIKAAVKAYKVSISGSQLDLGRPSNVAPQVPRETLGDCVIRYAQAAIKPTRTHSLSNFNIAKRLKGLSYSGSSRIRAWLLLCILVIYVPVCSRSPGRLPGIGNTSNGTTKP